MAASLEAKLIISAQDRTKATFDAILRRLDGVMERALSLGRATGVADRAMANVGGSIGRVEQSLGAAARTMESAARSMERAAAAMARVPKLPPGMPAGGGGGRGHGHGLAGQFISGRPPEHIARHTATGAAYGVGGIGGAVAAYTAFEAGEKAFEESAKREHERVRMQISDRTMSPAEQKEVEKHAAILAARYPQIDGTSVLHTLRNARAITGSYDDASALSDDIMKMRIVANAAKPGRDIEGETDQLLKAMELHGDTMNRAAFHDAISKINRVLAVEGDTLGPADIYQAAKLSRQALPTASRRFLYAAAPALVQDMGGASFGNSLSSFNRAFVGGRMDSRALQTALDLKLIDSDDVVYKGKKPIAVKPITQGGHGFKDQALAATDPDRYIVERLAPALKAAGITSPEGVAATTSILMSNRMAGQFVNTFLTQLARIQKTEANFAKAPDDPAAFIMAHDPQAAWQGLTNSLTNVAAATDASGHGVTAALNAVSAAMNDWAGKLQGVTTDHMKEGAARQEAGGRRDEARRLNKALYGVDSDQDLSSASPDDLAAAQQKAIGDLQAKLLPAMLKLKGLREEIRGRQADRRGVMGWLGFGQPTGALDDEAGQLARQIADIQAALARLRSLQKEFEALGRGPAASNGTDPAFVARAGVAGIPGAGHASFPLGSTYGHVDPATGRDVAPPPAASPYGGLGGAAASIKAQLEGHVEVHSTFEVKETSSFVQLVAKAQKAVSDSALINASSGNQFGMNVGSGARDTGVAGRKP